MVAADQIGPLSAKLSLLVLVGIGVAPSIVGTLVTVFTQKQGVRQHDGRRFDRRRHLNGQHKHGQDGESMLAVTLVIDVVA